MVGPAPHHSLRPNRPLWILPGTDQVVFFLHPIRHPFPHVTDYIVKAKCVGRKGTYRRGDWKPIGHGIVSHIRSAGLVAEISLFGVKLIAPGIFGIASCPGGVFPLRLSRKTFIRFCAKLIRFDPGDAFHRQVRALEQRHIGLHLQLKLSLSHLKLVHFKWRHTHLVNRLFIRLPLIAPHFKTASFQRNHFHRPC